MQKSPILNRNHGLTFWSSCFYSLERHCFLLWYYKPPFHGLFCLKKESWKVAILVQNHGLTTLEKRQFFDVLNFLVYIAYKTHFPGPYRLKKEVSKVANFRPKPWTNPFWKFPKELVHGFCRKLPIVPSFLFRQYGPGKYVLWYSKMKKKVNFSTFWTSCVYSLERRIFVVEYHKTHFPGSYCLNKKGAKMANFEPKPWTMDHGPLEKGQFFDFVNVFFFIA